MIVQSTNFGNTSDLKSGMHENHCFGDHIHQFSELVMVYDGEIEITTEGKLEVGRAGDVFIITPFRVHSFHTPVYSKIWICVFSNDFAADIVTTEELYRGRERSRFTPSKELFQYVDSRIKENVRDFRRGNAAAYVSAKACIHALLAEYLEKVPVADMRKSKELLSTVFLYIAEHYRERLTLDSLSAAIGYTPGHVSHSLKAVPGFNFNSLVNSLRVEYAKGLLMRSELRMIDVALESGFSCERSFHRAFRDIVGMTPGEYRKSRTGRRG